MSRNESKAAALRAALRSGNLQTYVGVHDGITAILADSQRCDGLWLSGLGVSAAHGVPDASIVTMTEMLAAAKIADRASGLPVIADCDTGFGDINNVIHMVRQYEQAGIAAVCIEDKVYPKRNSFTDGQNLVPAAEFAAKLMIAKRAQATADFMVFARIESLVAGLGLDDALSRARIYVKAGADVVLIHSKSEKPDEVIEFSVGFRREFSDVPLVVIPTTYPGVTKRQLSAAGVSGVIYANQILRAAVSAAESVMKAIDVDGSTGPIEGELARVQQLLALLGTAEIGAADRRFAEAAACFRAESVDDPGIQSNDEEMR